MKTCPRCGLENYGTEPFCGDCGYLLALVREETFRFDQFLSKNSGLYATLGVFIAAASFSIEKYWYFAIISLVISLYITETLTIKIYHLNQEETESPEKRATWIFFLALHILFLGAIIYVIGTINFVLWIFLIGFIACIEYFRHSTANSPMGKLLTLLSSSLVLYEAGLLLIVLFPSYSQFLKDTENIGTYLNVIIGSALVCLATLVAFLFLITMCWDRRDPERVSSDQKNTRIKLLVGVAGVLFLLIVLFTFILK